MSARYPNRLSLRLAWRALTSSFQFKGRSTRSELISFYILGIIATCAHISLDDSGPISPVLFALGLAWSILWSWPLVPLFVRRLHDQDSSGWWASIIGLPVLAMTTLYLLPEDMRGNPSNASISSGAIQAHFIGSTPAAWSLLGIFLVSILAIVIMNLLPGTIGPNPHGDDPRLPAASPAIFPAL